MKQNNKGKPTYLAFYLNPQGDEFAEFLDEANNNIPEALKLWAEDLMITSARIDDLSQKMGEYLEDNPDAKLTVMAEDCIIELDGPEELLNKLVKDHLLFKEYFSSDQSD